MSDTESLLEFPCDLAIKAMGRSGENLQQRVLEHVRKHAPDTPDEAARETASSRGRFVSITVEIHAESREQLDAIYQRLSDDPNILMAL